MASELTHPKPLPYSSAIERAGRRPPADEDGRGSFGPVLVVLAVISFLAVSACIAGRLCGRKPSKSSSRGEQQRGGGAAAHADAEKGFGVMQNPAAEVMRPVPSSRATVHDVDDDVFEIKLCAPVKPPTAAGRQGGSGGDGGGGSALQPRWQRAAAAAPACSAARRATAVRRSSGSCSCGGGGRFQEGSTGERRRRNDQ